MSTLTLVRHGQATPFKADTDRLSPLGERQARALARYFLKREVQFSEAYSGTLVRQRRTAEVVAAVYREAGQDFPEIRTDDRLREYDAESIMRDLAPQLAREHSEFGVLLRDSQNYRNTPERNRYFQRMLEALMQHWLGASEIPAGVESWGAFSSRTRAAFSEILRAPGTGRRVVVFTSGGVIGTAVQLALKAPDQSAFALNWRVKNASRTEFTFSSGRFSLDAFNVTGHLEAEGLESYR
ncbi:histidine phosphatase family protein [Deinococcus peraridilitoris]|uniref:Fructose-2,6-bisphosphatase n=1 Tax=Deinococcus peraridilitoris (strain DSM 19664 / LMG 22246 / CIP 109416 / KR-200) TaxID=937777 RepID=L0A163_DEIPD|nr:histidine phosphatase family protein [Deinococcus peraridilitoris]AFZ66750.1 fructose-2,6-bisphosphatase [Deinococcus peraridilitoris DSM 19664]